MVVHGSDGLDEITISGETLVGELKGGDVHEYTIAPQQFGLEPCGLDAIRVQDGAQSKQMVLSVLNNHPGPARDIVILNAGAAIYVAGLTRSLERGVEKAREAIESGAAKAKLDQFVGFSASLKGA
jgi:anthranilate phosphoribosyltransferase